MIELTFSKSGREEIILTEDDLFDFEFERGCFSGDTFELGGVSAKSIHMIIDNNTQRFPRGTFANSRVRLDIDGHFCGYFNAELPKRRNGVIELTAYDDMIKLDVEFPEDCEFPSLFWTVYAHCLLKAGLADHFSVVNGDIFVLNALFNNGVISHEYTEYIYANSCRNVVSGMAEWNGGFAYINDDGKLQVDVFSKEVSRTFYSGDLMDFDYSDETVTFSKIKTSQKNKTYEMGDDSGYTLVVNNQYISYGLDDDDFEMYLGFICDYYKGFSLTPMSFTLAEPDFDLKIGDRISVVDEEENVTVTGNISKITVIGNCSMTVTCGGFGNVSGVVNYNKSSTGQINQTKAEAGSGDKPAVPSVEMPYMDGINYYYIPETRAISEKLWKNHLSGEADNKGDISLPQGAVESGCALILENKQYGNMSTTATPATYYCLVKNNELLKSTTTDMLFGAVFAGSGSLGITMTISETKQNYPSETTNNSMGYKIQYSRVISNCNLYFWGNTDFSYQVSSISNVSIDGQAVYFGDQNWYEYSTSASGYDDRDRYLLEDGNIVYSSQNVILLPALQQHFLTEKDFTDYHVFALSIIPNEELKFSVTASSKKYSVTPQNLRFYVDGDLVGTSVFFPDKDNSKPSVRSHYLHFNINSRKAGSAAASYLSYAIGTAYHNAAMVRANSEWLLRKAVSDWKN